MANNVIVSKAEYASVKIHTISVRENYVNNFVKYDIPKTPAKADEGAEKILMNYLTIDHVYEIVGYIGLEQDGSTSANTLRGRLKSIFNAGGTCNISYQGDTITGGMSGLEFREMAMDKPTTTVFMVTLSILEGKERRR